jgi:hypothetical protein
MEEKEIIHIINSIKSAIDCIAVNVDADESGIGNEILTDLNKSVKILRKERGQQTRFQFIGEPKPLTPMITPRLLIRSPHKNVTKVIWENTDTFYTMWLKLKNLTGRLIINKRDESSPFTVFEVEKIKKTRVNNSFGKRASLMWGFRVHYGVTGVTGCTVSNSYGFIIPRTCNSFKKDIKKFPVTIDGNHPFVFY